MATEYLDIGAKTFADSAWDGDGIDAADDMIIDVDFGPVTAGLSWTGVALESMYFKPGSSGIVGCGASGSLDVDFDNSADAYLAVYGNVTLYYTGTCNNLSVGPGATVIVTGGTIGDIVVDGGFLSIAEGVSITGSVYINAGIVNMEYNAQDATLIETNGGTSTIKRAPSTLRINGGSVVFDPDENEGYTSKVLEVKGGRMDWRDGAFPTARLDMGTVDLRKNNRAFTPGATEGITSSACKIYRHPDVSLTNITTRGASKVDVGGATQID